MGGTGSGRKPNPYNTTLEHRKELQKSKVAQLYEHPRLDTVPAPEFPMGHIGKQKYRELAEALLKQGQLTLVTRGYVEAAAIAFEQIYRLQEEGKPVRAALLGQYNRALGNLQQLDVDKKTHSDLQQRDNKFRLSGFAARMR